MPNQRHPDKKPIGVYMFKSDKDSLDQNAKVHGVHVSDLVKASTDNYLRLNKTQQRKLLNMWQGRVKE